MELVVERPVGSKLYSHTSAVYTRVAMAAVVAVTSREYRVNAIPFLVYAKRIRLLVSHHEKYHANNFPFP